DAKGKTISSQFIPGGPVASQDPIEVLGDNGGGYFNVNGAHPLESPNPITNMLLNWLIIMIPFAFPFTFGRWVKSMGQGWVIFASMAALFIAGFVLIAHFEPRGNPYLTREGVSQTATATN